MELDDEMKQLFRELGRAINDAVAESKPVAEIVSKTRAAGFDFTLRLDGTVKIARLRLDFPKKDLRILESSHFVASFEEPTEP